MEKKGRQAVISYNIKYGMVGELVPESKLLFLSKKTFSQRAKKESERRRETDRQGERERDENNGALSKFLSNSLLC